MRAIGYFRQIGDPHNSPSFSEQQGSFHRFCEEQGYEPVVTFVDGDRPRTTNISDYERMLNYIRENGQDTVVIVKSLDVLHPDNHELLYCLVELDCLGASVLSTGNKIHSPLELALQLRSARSQEDKRGDSVKEAMKVQAVRGKRLGKTPYGYRLGADKRLEIVPQESVIVKLIYQLYLQNNMGVRLLARHLNEQGITTRRGGLWSIVGIHDILRNRTYLGTSFRFGFRVPDSHPAIIDRETFSKVQERLTNKLRKKIVVQKTPFPLSGIAYCGYCGNKMIGVNRNLTWTSIRKGENRKGEYRYYQCQSRTNQSICHYHTRRADALENIVINALRDLTNFESFERQAATFAPEDRASERRNSVRKLHTLDRRFRAFLDQVLDGSLTREELRTKCADLLWEKRLLEQNISLIDAEARQEIGPQERRDHVLKKVDELCKQWEMLTATAKNVLLQHVICRVVVYDDRVETILRL